MRRPSSHFYYSGGAKVVPGEAVLDVVGLGVVVVVGPEQLFKQSASVANCPSPGFVCIQP